MSKKNKNYKNLNNLIENKNNNLLLMQPIKIGSGLQKNKSLKFIKFILKQNLNWKITSREFYSYD